MPKTVDAAERRGAFVDAAWRVIEKEGLSSATLRRVAQEARCTTGALTHYFESREALLTAALASAHTQASARMKALTGSPSWNRLEVLIREALPLDAARLQEWRTRLAFWGEAVGSKSLRRENAQRFEEWRAFLRRELQHLVPNAAAREEEAALLMALVDGFALRLVLHGGAKNKDLMSEIDGALKAHFRALKSRYRLSALARAAR